jgi:hypothetical protein
MSNGRSAGLSQSPTGQGQEGRAPATGSQSKTSTEALSSPFRSTEKDSKEAEAAVREALEKVVYIQQ